MKGGLPRLKFLRVTNENPVKKNLKIAFLAVAPFIVKFRFEKLTNQKEASWILNQWERRVTNIFIWNNEILKKMGAVEVICKISLMQLLMGIDS